MQTAIVNDNPFVSVRLQDCNTNILTLDAIDLTSFSIKNLEKLKDVHEELFLRMCYVIDCGILLLSYDLYALRSGNMQVKGFDINGEEVHLSNRDMENIVSAFKENGLLELSIEQLREEIDRLEQVSFNLRWAFFQEGKIFVPYITQDESGQQIKHYAMTNIEEVDKAIKKLKQNQERNKAIYGTIEWPETISKSVFDEWKEKLCNYTSSDLIRIKQLQLSIAGQALTYYSSLQSEVIGRIMNLSLCDNLFNHSGLSGEDDLIDVLDEILDAGDDFFTKSDDGVERISIKIRDAFKSKNFIIVPGENVETYHIVPLRIYKKIILDKIQNELFYN